MTKITVEIQIPPMGNCATDVHTYAVQRNAWDLDTEEFAGMLNDLFHAIYRADLGDVVEPTE